MILVQLWTMYLTMYHVWCHLPLVGDYWTPLRSIKRTEKIFSPLSPIQKTIIQEHVEQDVNVTLSWLYHVRLYSFLIVTIVRVLVFRSPLRSSLSGVSPCKDLRDNVRHLLKIQNCSITWLVMIVDLLCLSLAIFPFLFLCGDANTRGGPDNDYTD